MAGTRAHTSFPLVTYTAVISVISLANVAFYLLAFDTFVYKESHFLLVSILEFQLLDYSKIIKKK